MTTLTKGMYSNPDCKRFKLQYNQVRPNDVIRNAGWFNIYGERIGKGDLSYKDLDNILLELDYNDAFIILNEADSDWNMPEGMDKSAPGIEYVMKHANWVVSALNKAVSIYYVKSPNSHLNDDHPNNFIVDKVNGIEYYEVIRSYLYMTTSFDGHRFTSIKPAPTVELIEKEAHFGLDVHHLSNDTSWAVSDFGDAWNAAMKAAQSKLWNIGFSALKKNSTLTDTECNMLNFLGQNYKEDSHSIFTKLLGTIVVELIVTSNVRRYGVGEYLSPYDVCERMSNEIKGLPPKMLAYRIK